MNDKLYTEIDLEKTILKKVYIKIGSEKIIIKNHVLDLTMLMLMKNYDISCKDKLPEYVRTVARVEISLNNDRDTLSLERIVKICDYTEFKNTIIGWLKSNDEINVEDLHDKFKALKKYERI